MVQAARRYHPFDARTAFIEGLTLTASDIVEENSADKILELGDGRVDGVLIVDVSALDIASNDELYRFILQGSNASDFSSGIENLVELELGDTAVRQGGAGDSLIGRYELPFQNAQAAAEYKYVRLNVIIAGTSPSITFDSWITIR
jgi:hypothetical protein